MSQLRAAAVQLAITNDLQANLQSCLRMIDSVALVQPDLIVLPEFCNHLAWYDDREHSCQVAVDLDGVFLGAIGAKAAEHGCYIMINVTLRRDAGKVTGSNILFDSNGKRIAVSDKQVLMGNENNFLEKATEACEIIKLPWGNAGMYSCMDGVIFEPSRGMAVRGAQILLNSLNSFAKDEGDLHIPVRAAESKVFVVAANKVGALVPPHLLELVAARLKIAPTQLYGAGHSQIVAPDGTVLAMVDHADEGFTYADIDLAQANDKHRPDGTDIMKSRRPQLYAPFASPPQPRQHSSATTEVVVGVYQPEYEGAVAIGEVAGILDETLSAGVKLLVLPELFCIEGGMVTDVAEGAQRCRQALALIKPPAGLMLATTIVELDETGARHTAVLWDETGVLLRQSQLHPCKRHSWVTQLGDGVSSVDVDWGRLALVAGNDAIYPETFRLLALQEVDVVAVCTHLQEAWEMRLGLLERSAENRLNLVVGSRVTNAGNSLILAADPDFTLWTEWQTRPFDGNINTPIVLNAGKQAGLSAGKVYPSASANRVISQKTDVVANRPYWLADTLL